MPCRPQAHSLDGVTRRAGNLVPDYSKQGAGKLLDTAAAQTLHMDAIGPRLLFSGVRRFAGFRGSHGVQFAR